jgi:hypothetical protein
VAAEGFEEDEAPWKASVVQKLIERAFDPLGIPAAAAHNLLDGRRQRLDGLQVQCLQRRNGL